MTRLLLPVYSVSIDGSSMLLAQGNPPLTPDVLQLVNRRSPPIQDEPRANGLSARGRGRRMARNRAHQEYNLKDHQKRGTLG